MNSKPFKANSFLFLFPLALLLCLYSLPVVAQQGPITYQSAVVKGKMMDLRGGKFQMQDLSENGSLKGGAMNYKIGEDSTFRLQINLNGPTYLKVAANELYVSPGDSITGLFYTTNGSQTQLSGVGAEVNRYLLSNPQIKNGSYLIQVPKEELLTLKDTPEKLEARISEIAEARRKELEKLGTEDQNFIAMEKARIEADIINSLLAYPSYYVAMSGVQAGRDEIAKFNNDMFLVLLPQITPHLEKINKGQFLNVSNCRNILFMLNQKQDQTKAFQFPWDGYVRSHYLTRLILGSVGKASITQISSEVERLKKLDALAPNHVQFIESALKPYQELMAGAPAIDFKIEDTNGQVRSLSDFKGQVIVIDFWATWCRPCLREAPHFERIKEEFPGMKFLSISTDRDKNKWINFVKNKPSSDGHFHVVGNDYGKYKVTSIPRFVVINKDFTIADAYAQRPSGGMKAFLEKLK